MYTLNTRLFFTNKAQHFFSFQSTIMEVNSGRGKEGRARHKISWMEMVQTDLKSLNVEVNLIYDQEEWRRRIHIGNPTSLGLRILFLLLLLLLLFACLFVCCCNLQHNGCLALQRQWKKHLDTELCYFEKNSQMYYSTKIYTQIHIK
jgi:hypothetical protein